MKNVLSIAVLATLLVILGGADLLVSQEATRAKTPLPVQELPEGFHSIVLTKGGFVPDTLTIRKGETIVFSTDTGNLFWPASNLHPSHLAYSEFDPKEPVQPDVTWSFTFDNVGEWEFHDHLAPYYTGVITVEQAAVNSQ